LPATTSGNFGNFACLSWHRGYSRSTSRELALSLLECIELPFYKIALCLFILRQHSTKKHQHSRQYIENSFFSTLFIFVRAVFSGDALTDVKLNDSLARKFLSKCEKTSLYTLADIEYM
jgi:hypothetical protein